jgi:hypothetical protein
VTPFYRIRDWNKHFENNRTRILKKLDWVPIPNKMDGDGYTQLFESEDGPLVFAAWILMVEVASKCEPRGDLLRDQSAHTAHSLARLTRCSAGCFEKAFDVLCNIGWLELVTDNPAPKCRNPALPCLEGKGREGKEGKGKHTPQYELLLSLGKFAKLDYESFVTTFHNAGQEITEEFIRKLSPLLKTADWSRVKSQGEARWLGWQISDLSKKQSNKRRSGSNI